MLRVLVMCSEKTQTSCLGLKNTILSLYLDLGSFTKDGVMEIKHENDPPWDYIALGRKPQFTKLNLSHFQFYQIELNP
jgi:hypothetical protein